MSLSSAGGLNITQINWCVYIYIYTLYITLQEHAADGNGRRFQNNMRPSDVQDVDSFSHRVNIYNHFNSRHVINSLTTLV